MKTKLMILTGCLFIAANSWAIPDEHIDAVNTLYALQGSMITPNYSTSTQTRQGVAVSSKAIIVSRQTLATLENARAPRALIDVLQSLQTGPGLQFSNRHREYFIEEINRTIETLMSEEN